MFGKLINPSLAIMLIKKQLKKQLKKDIEVFQIVYYAEKDKINFLIEKVSYDFENEKLKSAIQMQIAEYIGKDQKLDKVILDVNKEKITAYIAYTENDEKLFIEQKIN